MISQLVKFGLVGVLNTVITFIVIALLTVWEINPYLSNAVGFTAGLVNSFLMNSRFTFNQSYSAKAVGKFGISFALSYALNIFVLHYLMNLSTVSPIAAQFLAMVSYNITFFVLMKAWVFVHD